MTKFTAFAHSIGKTSINQDAFVCDTKNGVFAVLDGLGGGADGDKASKLTAAMIAAGAQQLPTVSQRTEQETEDWLVKTIMSAHFKVTDNTDGQTTASVIIGVTNPTDSCVVMLNIGDSRVYGYKKSTKQLILLTHDDSTYPHPRLDLVETETDITKSMRTPFMWRNIISRAIGNCVIGKIEASMFPLENIDGFLLTSDGVHDNLSYPEMQNIFAGSRLTPQKIVQTIINKAVARSQELSHIRHKRDDITALYVAVNQSK